MSDKLLLYRVVCAGCGQFIYSTDSQLLSEMQHDKNCSTCLDKEIKAEIDAIETEPVNLDIKPEDWLPTPEELERLLEED